MARTVRRYLTAWTQQEVAGIVLQPEEQADAKDGKVVVYYKLGIYYGPEGADPNDKQDTQEEEEVENFNTEYEKIQPSF